jgi:hypothetical protein
MSGNTSNGPKPSPLLKAAHLWAKSSVKGGQYLTGRWGALKVLVMENRDRKSDDDPSHILFFTEAPDRRQDAGERAQERSGGAGATHPPRTPQNASSERPGTAYGHGQRVPDHHAPLDYDIPAPARDATDDVPEWAK